MIVVDVNKNASREDPVRVADPEVCWTSITAGHSDCWVHPSLLNQSLQSNLNCQAEFQVAQKRRCANQTQSLRVSKRIKLPCAATLNRHVPYDAICVQYRSLTIVWCGDHKNNFSWDTGHKFLRHLDELLQIQSLPNLTKNDSERPEHAWTIIFIHFHSIILLDHQPLVPYSSVPRCDSAARNTEESCAEASSCNV